jgi:hypothetical protein
MPDFKDIQAGCPFRVRDKDLAFRLRRVRMGAEAFDQIVNFCIRRGAPGFMDVDGLDELSGFGHHGDPCVEGGCAEKMIMEGTCIQ